MITDDVISRILASTDTVRAMDRTGDDEVFVVRVLPGGHDDFELLATNAPVSLFMDSRLCALPRVVSFFKDLYSDEYADHEPWLIIFDNDSAIVRPILPPRANVGMLNTRQRFRWN